MLSLGRKIKICNDMRCHFKCIKLALHVAANTKTKCHSKILNVRTTFRRISTFGKGFVTRDDITTLINHMFKSFTCLKEIVFDTLMHQSCINMVPTFNSCTKCVGSPGIINDRTSDYHPVSWAWMHG